MVPGLDPQTLPQYAIYVFNMQNFVDFVILHIGNTFFFLTKIKITPK